MDWGAHRLHREHMVATRGQWIGLLDENGVPLMDMPSVVDAQAANARGSSEEVELTFAIAGRTGTVHKAVSELIADGLGETDSEGKLIPQNIPTRMLCIERDAVRYTYPVTHCTAEGGYRSPSTLRVHGLYISSLLEGIPAWSNPISITGEWHRLDRDYAAEWSKEMDLQHFELAAQADGFTITAAADIAIHRLVTESLAATWRAVGITDNPPIQVASLNPAIESPTIFIRPQDDNLWDTVTGLAQMSGVDISTGLWLPGDSQPAGLSLTTPTVVVEIRQEVN